MSELLRTIEEQLLGPDGPFPIDEITVDGVTMRNYADLPPSLRAIWEMAATFGDATYLVLEDERITYAEAHARVCGLARWLVEDAGVAHGDRVAIAMRNYPEWIYGFWAAVSVGASAVAMNAWWTGDELRYGLEDSAPKALLVDGERHQRCGAAADELEIATVVARAGALDIGAAMHFHSIPDAVSLPDADVGLDDDATVFYTSGTTGFPKGALGTHRNILSNLWHLRYWGAVTSIADELVGDDAVDPGAESSSEAGEDPGGGGLLTAVPLFHVTGCHAVLVPTTATGSKLVLMYKWDPAKALELIERERVERVTGVPSMTWDLLGHPDFESRDTSSLVQLGGGGAPMAPELVKRVDAETHRAQPSVGYGLTETSAVTTANSGHFFLEKPDTVGVAMPTVELKVVDEAGDEAPSGGRGELWIKGPHVVKGYINKPDETAAAFSDGWFRSGDIATIDDDGFVSIVDRAKDMIIRGGENVGSAEVEAAIYELPGVHECAVFGVPHERLGEEVAVAVMPRPGEVIDPETLRRHVAERLAAFKVPVHVFVRDEPLPRNPAGKFLKRQLRDEHAEQTSTTDPRG